MTLHDMISAHPDVQGSTADLLIACIEECMDCAAICAACADACLAEAHVDTLRQCIRLDLDCADICVATAQVAMRRTGSNIPTIRAMMEVCAEICDRCAAECRQHAAMHAHCAICADACARCAASCREAMSDLR